MSNYRVTIKQSVFENTGLDPEKYEGEILTFEDETEAQSMVDDMNEDLSDEEAERIEAKRERSRETRTRGECRRLLTLGVTSEPF